MNPAISSKCERPRARGRRILGWAASVALAVALAPLSASAQPAGSGEPPPTSATASATAPDGSAAPAEDPDARNTSFRPVAGGGNARSGELLLVEAYAVIWLVIFGLLFLSLRRQRALTARLDKLEADLARARGGTKSGAGSTPQATSALKAKSAAPAPRKASEADASRDDGD